MARAPDRIALEFEGMQISYAELNARANRLAHFLRDRGVGPDRIVGLCVERSIEMVVGVLGVLKAGGAYVPLEPGYPRERLSAMIEDAQPVLVLTQSALVAKLPRSLPLVRLDDSRDIDVHAAQDPARVATPGHLAYVIYTSGSTGRPKGVMVEHRALLNRIDWMQREYVLDADDVVLQKTPFGFDVSVWELTWPFVVGARLVIAHPEGHRDPAYLSALIRRTGVTTLHFVPSMLRLMIGDAWADCTSVRRVFCSGEALPADVVKAHYATQGAPLHNLYGPTEAAIDVTSWAAPDDPDLALVPIGRPIQNISLYVLGPTCQLVPRGTPGELHIGGIGLARGYLNLADLTAERFISNPFHDPRNAASSARLYRTGDRVRHLADGNLEYLGRLDGQLKIRGLRIEPGEIECQLAACDGVSDALVVARADGGGDPRLVAYVVPAPGVRLAIADLRARLARVLPEFMVPSGWRVLEALPLTTNGKVDRNALPPADDGLVADDPVRPRTRTEERVAMLWADLLGRERAAVGADSNFFALGGNSLLLIRMVRAVKSAFGVELSVSGTFAQATVHEVAQAIEAQEETLRAARGLAALSAAQVEQMEF